MAVVPVSIGSLYAIDQTGEAEGGVEFTIEICRGDGTAGLAINGAPITVTSDASTGLVEVQLIRGKRYHITRGDGVAVPFTVPDAATFDLPEAIGSP